MRPPPSRASIARGAPGTTATSLPCLRGPPLPVTHAWYSLSRRRGCWFGARGPLRGAGSLLPWLVRAVSPLPPCGICPAPWPPPPRGRWANGAAISEPILGRMSARPEEPLAAPQLLPPGRSLLPAHTRRRAEPLAPLQRLPLRPLLTPSLTPPSRRGARNRSTNSTGTGFSVQLCSAFAGCISHSPWQNSRCSRTTY